MMLGESEWFTFIRENLSVFSVFSSLLAAILGALIGAYINNKMTKNRNRDEKIWEKRLLLYSEIIYEFEIIKMSHDDLKEIHFPTGDYSIDFYYKERKEKFMNSIEKINDHSKKNYILIEKK